MNITTMMNAMERAKWRASTNPYDDVALRQYHAFRDGIHRRWLRMEIAKRAAEVYADAWKERALKDTHD